MRKIETAMLAAIISGRAFKSDNTEVTERYSVSPFQYAADIKLHGHIIARVYFAFPSGACEPQEITFSLCGWNTNTTRSRLNAVFSLMDVRPRVSTFKGMARISAAHSDTMLIYSDDIYRITYTAILRMDSL